MAEPIHPKRHRPIIGSATDEELLTEFFGTPEGQLYAVIEYLRRQDNPDRHVLNELEFVYRLLVEGNSR